MIKRVYKFGGASVKDAEAVKNIARILKADHTDDLMIVVSAMGKTTNAIEKALSQFREAENELSINALSDLMQYHEEIMLKLFDDENNPVFQKVADLFLDLYLNLLKKNLNYDYHYDITVSFGELISTTIIAAYLQTQGLEAVWIDARDYLITDARFRDANPDFDECRLKMQNLNKNHSGELVVTQGFIGSSATPKSTVTLGREGSDFSAAVFAYCLDAEEVVIWKDVDGIRNADPKKFDKTVKIPHLSYQEAIELAFYGASVIHPKTIKPLQNKNIPLKVKCFLDEKIEPTVIDGFSGFIDYCPSFIVKEKQTLVSITPKDFSFMNEKNISFLFGIFNEIGIHANMIQTSALMLSVCFNNDKMKLESLMLSVSDKFFVKYNDDLQLFTVRHYREGVEEPFVKGRKVILEQRNRNSIQLVFA